MIAHNDLVEPTGPVFYSVDVQWTAHSHPETVWQVWFPNPFYLSESDPVSGAEDIRYWLFPTRRESQHGDASKGLRDKPVRTRMMTIQIRAILYGNQRSKLLTSPSLVTWVIENVFLWHAWKQGDMYQSH